jgi:glycosyltransferase involved in cell wall biosynthesis
MKKIKADCLVIIQRYYIGKERKRGGADIIVDYLVERGRTVCMLEYQIAGKLGAPSTEITTAYPYSRFTIRNGGDEEILREFILRPRTEPFKWFSQLLITPFLVNRYVRGRISLCMAVDPLSAIVGLALRGIGKIDKLYLHSIDYSDNRFGIGFLNRLYERSYRFGVRRSDLVGVVSRRMLEKCAELSGNDNKICYVPNTPEFEKTPRIPIDKRGSLSLVMSANGVIERYAFDKVLTALKKLTAYLPNVSLKVIGSTELDPAYFKRVKEMSARLGLDENIVFTGFLPREESHNAVASSRVGLACYSLSYSHVRYGDSLKIREYAACGLPTVADDVTSTAHEAAEHGAGFACASADEMAECLYKLVSDDQMYRRYSDSAVRWARQFDKEKILDRLCARLEI